MAEQSATHKHDVAKAIIENIRSSTPRHIVVQRWLKLGSLYEGLESR